MFLILLLIPFSILMGMLVLIIMIAPHESVEDAVQVPTTTTSTIIKTGSGEYEIIVSEISASQQTDQQESTFNGGIPPEELEITVNGEGVSEGFTVALGESEQVQQIDNDDNGISNNLLFNIAGIIALMLIIFVAVIIIR